MSYSVRLMAKEDLAQVAEIDREAFPTQWPPPNYKQELQNQLARYIVVCDEAKLVEVSAVRAGPLAGLYGLALRVRRWFHGNHSAVSAAPPPGRPYIAGFAGIWVLADEAHITNIAVRERYRRRGVGELLLIHIVGLAKEMKADVLTLEVRVSNTAAQSLYSKYGFAKVGVRRGYYVDNREDGLIMTTESISSATFQARLQELKQSHSRRWGSHELVTNYSARPGKQ